MERRFANAAGGVVLTVRVVRGVQQAEALGYAFAQVLAIALKGLVAAHIHFPEVLRRVADAYPLGDHPADAAGGLQTDGIQARRHEAIVEFRRLADVVAHVRRKTFRSAEEGFKPGGFQCRHAHHGLLENGFEMLHAAGDFVKAEVLGNALGGPGAGMRLESAEEQLSGVVLIVRAGVIVAHHREARIQPRHRFKQRVVVLAGMQGHVHPDRCRQFPGPHAGAQHHEFGGDIALIGGHSGHASGPGANGGDGHVLKDTCAGRARALGQRIGDVHGVGVAVRGNVDPAEKVPGVQQRSPRLDCSGRHHFHVEPEDLRHRRAPLEFLEPFLVGGERKGTAAPVAGGLAGFLLQAQVELAGIARQFRHVD